LSLDTNTAVANYDAHGNSYSQTALAAAGFTSGGTISVAGLSFIWPTVAAGTPDNWQSAGQTVTLTAAAGNTTLGVLGSATNGPSSGLATTPSTDASVQPFTLPSSDWPLPRGTQTIAPTDLVATPLPYRNTPTGPQTQNIYLFYTSVAINPAKTVQSLKLPATV